MFDLLGLSVAGFFLLLFAFRAYRRGQESGRNRDFVAQQKDEMTNIIERHNAEKLKKESDKPKV
jgi:hypothetical protein